MLMLNALNRYLRGNKGLLKARMRLLFFLQVTLQSKIRREIKLQRYNLLDLFLRWKNDN